MALTVRSSLMWSIKSFHYLLCLLVVLLTITTVGTFQVFLSRQTLSGQSQWNQESSVLSRFLWDAALLVCFMGQHTMMASPCVKDKLSSWLGITVSQRLIYTAASSVTLLFCVLKWQAIPETGLWVVDTSERWLLWLFFLLLHVVAWFFWTLQVFLMDVGELLGVSQVHCYYKGRPQPLMSGRSSQQLQNFYSHLRHPGPLLITVVLWAHPLMTLDRLLLACWFSCYTVYRHSTTDAHYTFAEKHFSKIVVKKQATSSVTYDYDYDEDWGCLNCKWHRGDIPNQPLLSSPFCPPSQKNLYSKKYPANQKCFKFFFHNRQFEILYLMS